MSVNPYTEVEETLLLLSEARERAERAAQAIAEDGPPHVVQALQGVDRELLALHRGLLDETLFHVEGAEPQLELDAA